MTRSALSVVVPTRDRPDQLRRCLTSLRAALRDDDELLVVDSASRAASTVEAISQAANARYLRTDQPGVNLARNIGWQHATHDVIAYVDDDVVVDAGWADALAGAAFAHPEASFITGRLSPLTEAAHGGVAVKDDPTAAPLTWASRGDLGHGASLLVRASALAAVGGWDEAMGAGARFRSAPEADLYDRLFLIGHVGRYEPSARAWHDQWRSPRQLLALDWRYGFGNGARLAKLTRMDRRRARRVAAEAVWSWGLRRLGAPLRDRNKTEVGRIVLRLAGTAAGFVRGLTAPVRDGHYANRPKHAEMR